MTDVFYCPTSLATRAGRLSKAVERLICECAASRESVKGGGSLGNAVSGYRDWGVGGWRDSAGNVSIRVSTSHKIQDDILGIYKLVGVNRQSQDLGRRSQGIDFFIPDDATVKGCPLEGKLLTVEYFFIQFQCPLLW